MLDFKGLPRSTPAFLRALALNNRKDWFEAALLHKACEGFIS
jgi:hypothetical protein